MKLFLNSFFISLLFVCNTVFSEDYQKKFTIKVSGVKIGKLSWEIKIDDEYYFTDLRLESQGFLSAIYKFNGEYYAEGFVHDNKLKPYKYKHIWKTNKITKDMNLVFENNKLKSLNQVPVEKEELRVNVFNIEKSKDPLTSFLQIVLGEKNSLVVDGRRTYTMNAVYNKETKQTNINISDYSNLWTDHSRRKFEKLTFEKNDEDFLPYKINIYFDGRVFKLEEY